MRKLQRDISYCKQLNLFAYRKNAWYYMCIGIKKEFFK